MFKHGCVLSIALTYSRLPISGNVSREFRRRKPRASDFRRASDDRPPRSRDRKIFCRRGGEGALRTKFDERKVETRERERDEKEGEGEGERRRESTSEKERKKLFSLPFHSRRCSRFFNRPSPPPPPPSQAYNSLEFLRLITRISNASRPRGIFTIAPLPAHLPPSHRAPGFVRLKYSRDLIL